MTLQQLRYLCEVACQDLNISRAAAALHVSQPGLSRQLQLLEKELAVELFVRNKKRLVRLSQAGAEIHRIAERTLEGARNIREAAREQDLLRLTLAIALAIAGWLNVPAVHAQSYPERPLRFVIPFPPGGGADNLARIVGQSVGEKLGQPIVIDNRSGAGGNIAAEVVSKAAPDGYTLLQANVSHAISTSLYRKLNYDLLRDFAPVTQLASIPFVLAVNPGINASSVKEVVARARAKPGELAYASSGSGGPSHLAMELFKSMAGVDIRHIPYKGAAPIATDLISGQVHMAFFTVSAALPHIGSGRVKPIAIASARRSSLAPDLPTFHESGLPGFEATTWFGVMTPRGTPQPVVGKLHAVFTDALKAPDVRDRVLKQGFEIVGSTPTEFASYVRAEIPKWAKVVKASGASVD